jgi:phage anti-repressor protein
MDIQQIIDITSESSQQSLLQYLKDHLTNDQQQLFVENFYLTFFDKGNGFTVDGDKAMEWIGYKLKHKFVNSLQKYLVQDQDWVFTQVGENSSQAARGRPRTEYKLTVNGFKKLGMKANTERGNAIREYYIEIEKYLMNYAIQQSLKLVAEAETRVQGLLEDRDNLMQERSALERELTTFRNTQVKPCIYIYDMDNRVPSEVIKKSLKIGITENLYNRVKPYRQIAPYGRSVFSIDVDVHNLKTAEHWLHMLLKPYCVGGEVFEMTVEEAKLWITKQVNTLRISEIYDYVERYTLLSKMVDTENDLMNFSDRPKMSTTEIGTQTDSMEIESISPVAPVIPEQQIDIPVAETFNQFIEECCELHPDYEIPTVDIIGQFRLWKRQAAKEVYYQCLEYLKTRFCPVRVKNANDSNVVNGFRGVRLKPIDYRSVNIGSDYDLFLNHLCVFSPSGKILRSRLSEAYENWCKRNNKNPNSEDFLSKLEACPHVLHSNVWTLYGGGIGYYGISLKTDEIRARKASTNAKRVEKRTIDHVVVDTFPTIAKAAENENMPPCNMSRIIRLKQTYNGHYFLSV